MSWLAPNAVARSSGRNPRATAPATWLRSNTGPVPSAKAGTPGVTPRLTDAATKTGPAHSLATARSQA